MGRKVINVVDLHAGEPGRVVLGQDLRVRGSSMAERLRFCEKNLNWFRRLVLSEPRGYPAVCAPLITAPVNPDSAFGLIVMEQGGFRPMSGSNLICAVTALAETGAIDILDGEETLRVDTAVGTVEVTVTMENGRASNVRFSNVPSFSVERDLELDLPEYGKVTVDIAFGGQFYVLADASQFGLDLTADNTRRAIRVASLIHAVAARDVDVLHPVNSDLNTIALPMLYQDSPNEGVDARHTTVLPNGVVDPSDPETWDGVLDRSPCGTGTSSRIATEVARGRLQQGDTYVAESLVGVTFTGEVGEPTTCGYYDATTPIINGRAWITGINQLVLEPDDPFQAGYRAGDIWGRDDDSPNNERRGS